MPFPFLPGGVLLAIAVLGGALALFGLALRAMDRAIDSGRRTMLPGLVSGFRRWADAEATRPASVGPGAQPVPAAQPGPAGIELVEISDRRITDDEPGA